MMNRFCLFFFLFTVCFAGVPGYTADRVVLDLLPDEQWWGGAIVDGPDMPFGASYFSHDLLGGTKGNQAQPLLLSNLGRYVWCDDPFAFEFNQGKLVVESSFGAIQTGQAGKTLREGYRYASQTFFPPAGGHPHDLLFTRPQYNTWIELMYDQNQQDILRYAEDILKHGFAPGVLMIDDNWQEDYGTWEFKASQFPDPKAMMNQLHEMGFTVMLWVCPFISPDSAVYRELRDKRVLLAEDVNFRVPAIIRWWNGASALLDLSNPDGRAWFEEELQKLVDTYGVDGFKLDAGDANFYKGDIVSFEEDIYANRHTELFARIGLRFQLNEYRACWKMAGQPLAQRLRDKGHNWDDLRQLIPGILAQGLAGYAFTCPDMIGGGEYRSFLTLDTVDQELIVRSTQCHALMPMMQFSVAPWRVLTKEQLAICKNMTELHSAFADKIMALADHAAKTGEPIVRHLEYVFPHQGYVTVDDQFMVGDDILVAPVMQKGQTRRMITFPRGVWHGDDGSVVEGPCEQEVSAPLERLPYYKKK
jgi:alpha-glucosidase (family GH31 glycosyl hydrolase)